jgi:hypothetical protein
MNIPSVMFLEMAIDTIKKQDSSIQDKELKEFNSLGPQRKAELVRFMGGNEMAAGYILGLETARVLLATNVEAIKARISV